MGSPGGGVDSSSGPGGGGGPGGSDGPGGGTDRSDDNDRGGSRDDKDNFDRAMDNANRPDRAPASPPDTTTSPDDESDTAATDKPDDRSDRAAGPPGIGAPPSSSPPDATGNDTDDDDEQSRAAGPPGIGAPPSTPDTDGQQQRAAGPPGIGAPPSTPEADDQQTRAAGPPGIGAPPPNAEDIGPAMTGNLDPGLTPDQSESLAEGAAVMQGSTFAGSIATIGAGMARGFGMGFGGVYATAGPPSVATPVPHDDAIVAAGATIVGAGAAIYGGYQAYQALTEPAVPPAMHNESSEESEGDKALGGHNVGDLTASGAEPDPADKSGDLSKAGRAIDKHGNRPGSAFDKPSGTPAEKNAAGEQALDDIVNDEDATVKEGNRFGGFDVYDSEGKGARFDKDGKFKGFLEPPRQ